MSNPRVSLADQIEQAGHALTADDLGQS